MNAAMTVRTFLESVPIDDLRHDASGVLDDNFSKDERDALGGAVRTKAGFLALKKALVALAAHLQPDRETSTADIILGHGPGGEPRVIDAPFSLDCEPGVLKVSISHDSTTAYGLAVYQEPKRDDH